MSAESRLPNGSLFGRRGGNLAWWLAGKAKEELESTFVVKYCCKLAAVPLQEGLDMRVPMYNGACTRA